MLIMLTARLLFLVVFCNLLIGCSAPNNALSELRADLDSCSNVSIVFIGDSITWGFSANDLSPANPRAHSLSDPRNNFGSGSWVNLLVQYIRDSYRAHLVSEAPGTRTYSYCKDSTITVTNNGIVGSNSNQWSPGNGILEEAVGRDDKYIFIMLGINDRTSRAWNGNFTEKNLNAIASSLKASDKKIVMQTYLPLSEKVDFPAFKKAYFSSDDVNSAIRRVALSNKVTLIDNNELALGWGFSPENYLADGLHPNKAGHSLIFQNVINEFK